MDIMERLKTETAQLHSDAENHRFQKAMLKGELSKAYYVAWLEQVFVVHTALEAALRDAMADTVPTGYEAITSDQFQVPYLLEDFKVFGVNPDAIEPVPATQTLVAEIERMAQVSPDGLLGFHYVLEGANNGNRFIAARLRAVYELEPGKGDRYLDPYGEAQRQKWADFKTTMSAAALSAAQKDEMVEAAKAMFIAVRGIGEDLLAAEAAV